MLDSNDDMLSVCAVLLGDARLDAEERSLLEGRHRVSCEVVSRVKELVAAGRDPLGEAYIKTNSASSRRSYGSIYTPYELVESMLWWSELQLSPKRIVDCGCGSGRFAIAAAKMFPNARVVAVDCSAMATLVCKTNAVLAGVQTEVLREDFTRACLPFKGNGPTLWIGNPRMFGTTLWVPSKNGCIPRC